MKKTIGFTTVLITLLSLWCKAEIYVVVNPDNPVEEMSLQEVRDLYLARSKAFPNGEFATVYDQSDPARRERFFQTLTNMSIRQFDAFWAKLVFAGRVLPLNKAEGEKELIEAVQNGVDAIGYLMSKPPESKVKTLLVIGERQ